MSFFQRAIDFFGGDKELLLLASSFLCLTMLAFVLIVGGGYWLSWRIRLACVRAQERKKRRAATARRLKYTLPDRENSYVRARLNTALKAETGEEPKLLGGEKQSVGLRLGYTRKMLARVREAALSPVERLDVEEMARLLALYVGKEKWSGADVKAINEMFSRLLKLSAKYEIAV